MPGEIDKPYWKGKVLARALCGKKGQHPNGGGSGLLETCLDLVEKELKRKIIIDNYEYNIIFTFENMPVWPD
jgi:hypothetical protein